MDNNLSARCYQKKKKQRKVKKASWKVSKSYQRRKGKKHQRGRDQYKNIPEHKKQRFVDYRKKVFKVSYNSYSTHF